MTKGVVGIYKWIARPRRTTLVNRSAERVVRAAVVGGEIESVGTADDVADRPDGGRYRMEGMRETRNINIINKIIHNT